MGWGSEENIYYFKLGVIIADYVNTEFILSLLFTQAAIFYSPH